MKLNPTIERLQDKGAKVTPIAPDVFGGRACELDLAGLPNLDLTVDFSQRTGPLFGLQIKTKRKLNRVLRGLDFLVLRNHLAVPDKMESICSDWTQMPHSDNSWSLNVLMLHRDGQTPKSVETFVMTPENAAQFYRKTDPELFEQISAERFLYDGVLSPSPRTTLFKLVYNYSSLITHRLGVQKKSPSRLALAAQEKNFSQKVSPEDHVELKNLSHQVDYPEAVPTTVLIKNWRLFHGAMVTQSGQPDSHYKGFRASIIP